MQFFKKIFRFSSKTFIFLIRFIKRIFSYSYEAFIFLTRKFCFLFTKTHSYNESNNLDIKNLHNYSSYDQLKFESQKYGLCPECNQPNTFETWCKECYSKKFKENFGYWTSGNKEIDEFIQKTQLNARSRYKVLEWIPYSQLRNIKKFAEGGEANIYSAIWVGGNVRFWDYERQNWQHVILKLEEEHYYKDTNNLKNPLKNNEKYGYHLLLKSLKISENKNFLKEVSLSLY
jgi:hypothetical protein